MNEHAEDCEVYNPAVSAGPCNCGAVVDKVCSTCRWWEFGDYVRTPHGSGFTEIGYCAEEKKLENSATIEDYTCDAWQDKSDT